jgi:hypothetical protein
MKDAKTAVQESFNAPGEHRIEVSGWGADNSFFVERARLVWTADGEKRVQLRHELPQGAVIFARSISIDQSNLSVPVTFKAKSVRPMISENGYQVDLVQMRPRTQLPPNEAKESPVKHFASNNQEAKRACAIRESQTEAEHEEILR